MSGDSFPNRDIPVTEEFLTRNEGLLIWLSLNLMKASLDIPDVIDLDLREALDALVKTYRTLQSGLVYETRPANPMAAALCDRVQQSVEDLRKRSQEVEGLPVVRDAEVLGILAFLQRMELQQNNGRRRSRAFIDFLRRGFPPSSQIEEPSSLIS